MSWQDTDCMLWDGPLQKGYGSVNDTERCRRLGINRAWEHAHRIAWLEQRGPIPEGMEVCHSCNVKRCVNIDHLYVASHMQNVRDAIRDGLSPQSIKRTHCKRGHQMEGDNIYMRKKENGSPKRVCRTCRNEKNKKWMRHYQGQKRGKKSEIKNCQAAHGNVQAL